MNSTKNRGDLIRIVMLYLTQPLLYLDFEGFRGKFQIESIRP